MPTQNLVRPRLLPRRYFVVSGAALSSVSPLNAFDAALKNAGMHNFNLVVVSSILPKGIAHLKLTKEEITGIFEPGEIIFIVEACAHGKEGEYLFAGLKWAEGLETNGIVVEHSCNLAIHVLGSSELRFREDAEELLEDKFREAVNLRGIKTREPFSQFSEVNVPESMYGCALTALVFC